LRLTPLPLKGAAPVDRQSRIHGTCRPNASFLAG